MKIQDVLNSTFPFRPGIQELEAPPYLRATPVSESGNRIALAVRSMQGHMTDEGWQIMQALQHGGYTLFGFGIPVTGVWQTNATSVPYILDESTPSTVVVQDKREWEGRTAGPGFDHRESFRGIQVLKGYKDVFKVTILKDAQNSPDYHRESAYEIGCHAWIVYYHPRIVKHLAPYVREKHLIRTYHSIDSDLLQSPFPPRAGVLLSGALSGAYPWRQRLVQYRSAFNGVVCKPHPGYHRRGTETPDFLNLLTKFKVAICTSSIYGYALRKIIEATAAGCRVVTNLPEDEVLPEIDGNLLRVDPSISMKDLSDLLEQMQDTYNPGLQQHYAHSAKCFYDYRVQGIKLALDIEQMRKNYNA